MILLLLCYILYIVYVLFLQNHLELLLENINIKMILENQSIKS